MAVFIDGIGRAGVFARSQKAVYPAGITAASGHQKEARLFIDFLASEEGLAVFQKYGFRGPR
ncbi:MAG: substrate-binding domain-containing protein [Treponema sp.]|nr:substrate-binding domain-containing protein [Treponema sp.]